MGKVDRALRAVQTILGLVVVLVLVGAVTYYALQEQATAGGTVTVGAGSPGADSQDIDQVVEVVTGTPELAAMEQRFLEGINRERALVGAPPLRMHEGLRQECRVKAAEMLELGYFGHSSPTMGGSSWDARALEINRLRGDSGLCEAVGHQTAEGFLEGYKGSEPHWRILMDPKYSVAGVGIARSSGPVVIHDQLGGPPFEASQTNTTLVVEE